MRPRPVTLALLLSLAASGCDAVETRGVVVQDEELRRDGAWTERDAEARALLDRVAPPGRAGAWPVRLAPVHLKLLTQVGDAGVPLLVPRVGVELVKPDWDHVTTDDLAALLGLAGVERASLADSAGVFLSAWSGVFTPGALDVLFGLDYEPRATYVPAARATVLLLRERPACVIADDPLAGVELGDAPTPERAFALLRAELERDLRRAVAAPVTGTERGDLAGPGARGQSAQRAGPRRRRRRPLPPRRVRGGAGPR